MDLNIIDNVYDWDDISLLDYLNENNVPSNWNDFFYKTEIQNILKDISDHLSNVKKTIYPDINHVFRAFYETPLSLYGIPRISMKHAEVSREYLYQ